MSLRYSYNITPQAASVSFEDGSSFTWPSTHPNFGTVVNLIFGEASGEEIRDLMDTVGTLKNKMLKVGDVEVSRDGVTYKGEVIQLSGTNRILEFLAEGEDVMFLLKFFDNLFKNPYRDSVLSMYDFLEKNKVPITKDGTFFAYKKVRDDYKDYHSGKFDNSVGTNSKLEGWQVDPDRNRECSHGLHVCASHYLPHYYGGRGHVMICEVNPAHVYAVPHDYNHAKMRVTEYKVVGELNDEQKAHIFDGHRVVSIGDEIEGVKWADPPHADDPTEIDPEDDYNYDEDFD